MAQTNQLNMGSPMPPIAPVGKLPGWLQSAENTVSNVGANINSLPGEIAMPYITNTMKFLQNPLGQGLKDIQTTNQNQQALMTATQKASQGQPLNARDKLAIKSGINTVVGGITGGSDDIGVDAEGNVTNPSIAAYLDQTAKTNDLANGVQDTLSNAATQPGGFQAGFIGDSDKITPSYTIPKMPQSELDKFNLPPAQLDMYSPSKITDIKDTLDNDVPGTTWNDKFVNLKGTNDALEQQIKDSENVNIPTADYQKAAEARLKPLVTAGKITDLQAKQVATNWMGRIYDAAQGEMPQVENTMGKNGEVNIAPPTQSAVPEFIDKDTAVAMHRANNDAVSTLYGKDGMLRANLTDQDLENYALRNASSDVLKKNVPDVSDLLTKQSHLYKADNVVGRLAQDETEAAVKAANNPNWFAKIKSQNPLTTASEIGGLVYAGSKVLPDIMGAVGGVMSSLQNKQASQTGLTNGKPSVYNQIKPTDLGIMDENSYGTSQAALKNKIDSEKLNNPNQANTDQGVYDSNTEKYNAQQKVRDQLTTYNNTANLATTASTDLQNAPASLFNASQSYEGMMEANNGAYAKLAGDINALSQAVGYNLFTAKSPDALRNMIAAAVEKEKSGLTAAQTSFGTASANGAGQPVGIPTGQPSQPSSSMPSLNWQQNAPQVQAVMQQGQNISSSLPPISSH